MSNITRSDSIEGRFLKLAPAEITGFIARKTLTDGDSAKWITNYTYIELPAQNVLPPHLPAWSLFFDGTATAGTSAIGQRKAEGTIRVFVRQKITVLDGRATQRSLDFVEQIHSALMNSTIRHNLGIRRIEDQQSSQSLEKDGVTLTLRKDWRVILSRFA